MILNRLRKKIDQLDRQIIELIEKRMVYALQTKNLKSEFYDQSREEEVFRNYAHTYSELLTPVFRKELSCLLVNYSRCLQEGKHLLVGFQGWWGAFSQQAALRFLPEAQTLPLPNFYQLLNALKRGNIHYAVLPVFNSTSGWIQPNLKLLDYFKLECCERLELPVEHFLLAIEEVPLIKLKRVYAHPQALIQCQQFIQKNKLPAVSCADGAIAALKIWQKADRRVAVIGSSLLVRYGLKVIASSIQDNPDNHTIFYLLRNSFFSEKKV